MQLFICYEKQWWKFLCYVGICYQDVLNTFMCLYFIKPTHVLLFETQAEIIVESRRKLSKVVNKYQKSSADVKNC